jgi:hypothetical protein
LGADFEILALGLAATDWELLTEAAFLGRILSDPTLAADFEETFGADLAEAFEPDFSGALGVGLEGLTATFAPDFTTGGDFFAAGLGEFCFANGRGWLLEALAGTGFDLGTTFTGALLFLESFDFFEADDTGVAFFSGTLLFLDLDAIRY